MITLNLSHARKQRGFTLTEIAIVLGVIGSILGAIWAASAKVSAASKVERASEQVGQIINAYRTLYAQHGLDTAAGWKDITCIGVNGNFFPSDMMPTPPVACVTSTFNTYPHTPWGANTTTVVEAEIGTNTILVQYGPVSKADCNALANTMYATADISYEAILNVDTNTWTGKYLPPGGGVASYKPSEVSVACGGTSNIVQMGYPVR